MDDGRQAGQIWISADAFSGSVELAKSLGFDIGPYLDRHGIDAGLINTAQGLITFSAMSDCLEDIARNENCPDIGFLLAIVQRPLQFGMISQVLQFAPTLGEAVRIFLKYRVLYSQSSHWELHVADGIAYLRRYDIHARVTKGPQILIHSIVRGFEALKSLASPGWSPFGIYLSCDPQSISPAMRRHFGSPVFFNAQFDEIAFAESDLDQRLPSGNPELLAALAGYFDRLLPAASRQGPVGMQVQKTVRARMGDDDVSLAVVAQAMGLHPRALQRALAAEGTSYRAVLQDTRMQIAEQMVETTRMPLGDVAMLTGYQHLSSFSRAFKRERNLPASRQRQTMVDNGL